MMAGIGTDLVEMERFRSAIRRQGDRLLQKLFTPEESRYCEERLNRLAHYAARFAGKEAVLKALGTGWSGGIAWTDINIVRLGSGSVKVELSGIAARVAEELGVKRILLSLSHTDRYASAFAVAEQ